MDHLFFKSNAMNRIAMVTPHKHEQL